ncbi:MAG: RNA methyltransferase [Bacteroidales bacterium]|nr:RNA methyltransferase [Bacteroidales bacterium]MDD4830499.1 RNA methyltransferase [Bacteroidales bacterium]
MNNKLSLKELNRISVEEFKEAEKLPLVIVLDNVRSMNNVGSVFRTSDAFVVEKIYLCGITPKPPHREINKTALGATETVQWEYTSTTQEAISDLKQKGYKIYSIEQATNSVKLNEFVPVKNSKIAIVMGNEVDGVDQEIINLSDSVIEIPQYGTKHSLNISVTTGIVVWHLFNCIKE